jgi:hypothetical protein
MVQVLGAKELIDKYYDFIKKNYGIGYRYEKHHSQCCRIFQEGNTTVLLPENESTDNEETTLSTGTGTRRIKYVVEKTHNV